MKAASPAAYELAQRVAAWESDAGESSEGRSHSTLRAFGKLRQHLSKLVGVAGFQAILSRALASAKVETPWLETVQVSADGTLEGFDEAATLQTFGAAELGSASVMAHLLELMHTFVGEDLTAHVVADVWRFPSPSLRDTPSEKTPSERTSSERTSSEETRTKETST